MSKPPHLRPWISSPEYFSCTRCDAGMVSLNHACPPQWSVLAEGGGYEPYSVFAHSAESAAIRYARLEDSDRHDCQIETSGLQVIVTPVGHGGEGGRFHLSGETTVEYRAHELPEAD